MKALLIDFGSTYTKLRAVDLARGSLLASASGPSTVTTDVAIGLKSALTQLEHTLGVLPEFAYRLASSSAAGGLRMVTVGLVRELTAEAARQAALGAGAKLVGAFAYRLTPSDIARIAELAPDILLLAGGTDGGNADVILANARSLTHPRVTCPIVIAGNRVVAEDIQFLLTTAGKSVAVTENVMAEFGALNVEPAREAIRKVFIERIVRAKGIERARSMFDQVLMPTPVAVLEGARLLAEGRRGTSGLGPLVVVDVGGATTDVHSIATGAPTQEGIVVRGLPEPYMKRTVEGDLGVRHNAQSIWDTAGWEAIAAEAGLPAPQAEEMVKRFNRDPEHLATEKPERDLERALTRAAVRVAMRRHAGTMETTYTAMGPVMIQRGKDLGDVGAVIGTGGPIAKATAAGALLAPLLADPNEPFSLRPRSPRLYIDSAYILYAVGLLAGVEPDAALALGLGALQLIDEDSNRQVPSISRN